MNPDSIVFDPAVVCQINHQHYHLNIAHMDQHMWRTSVCKTRYQTLLDYVQAVIHVHQLHVPALRTPSEPNQDEHYSQAEMTQPPNRTPS